ncbi:MAG: GNAT family N-acetyltransferase [Proteobacteria bacterium]|nr:GNAT family N-acetyltransferase [Pseudomonadota bacterium]
MFPELFRDDVFTLETPRLFLRWPKAADQAAIVEFAGDRRVAEMTTHIPHPYPPEEAMRFILAAREANTGGDALRLAIVHRREPKKLIGMIGLQARDSDGARELGYWLGVPHWGQGLMTEAAQAIIDAAFLYSGLKAVKANVRVTNAASRKVLELCGFQYEGGGMIHHSVRGDSMPADGYRLTRDVWASLKGWRMPLPQGRENAAVGM